MRCLGRFCLPHYKQFKRTGELWPLGTRRPVVKVVKICTSPGCDRPFYAKGKCVSHWARIRDGYNPENPIQNEAGFWHECAIPDCDKEASFRFPICFPHRDRARKYGLTIQELIDFWGDGKCKVCSSTVKLSVHHDHNCCAMAGSCGKCVVALLCDQCNKAAGSAGDDPERLRRLADVIDLTSANRS